MNKRCVTCGATKPITDFYGNKARSDGLQTYCKDCNKKRAVAYYQKNKESYVKRNQQARVALREWVASLKSVPCVDCGGEFPPCCMDFDHRDPSKKSFGIAQKMRLSPSRKTLENEMLKCDIVCSNCHRIRTHMRLGSDG